MEKGLDVFAETMAELRRRGVPHKVLVVGEGPARAWFAERVPEARFTGMLIHADLGRAVASMDILLNPSVTETFGNVTLEAMACAVPVVAALATGATSLVADGANGMLVDPTEIEEFADALEAYARAPELRRKHGKAGLAFARTMDWDRINSAVIRTYNHAIVKRERLTRLTRRA
jgi:glycosyltransferase involved in cell wall biosynthesis